MRRYDDPELSFHVDGWPGGGEEFDMERLPGNPRMCESVTEFLRRQRKFIGNLNFPPGTTFECVGCGDCCKWYFIVLDTDLELAEQLREREKYPWGVWTLIEDGRIRVEMPNFLFMGNVPPDTSEYIIQTGRRRGYWTLNKANKVMLYNPTPCIHFTEDGKCGIHEDENRPRACKVYFCRRHPIIP